MKISNRLSLLAKYVPFGARVADIGTDHAYLPIHLIRTGKINFAIATDISKGPCEAAIKSINDFNCNDNILVRQGNGLLPIKVGEVDTLTIAGMGGRLIASILSDGEHVINSIGLLILQPMGESAFLRKWLLKNNYKIEKEDLVIEKNKLYEVVIAKKNTELEAIYDDFLYEVGPYLYKTKHIHLKEHLKNIYNKYDYICRNMEKSKDAVLNERYKKMLKIKERAREELNAL